MPEHDEFDVLGGGRAAHQQDSPSTREDQVAQPQRHVGITPNQRSPLVSAPDPTSGTPQAGHSPYRTLAGDVEGDMPSYALTVARRRELNARISELLALAQRCRPRPKTSSATTPPRPHRPWDLSPRPGRQAKKDHKHALVGFLKCCCRSVAAMAVNPVRHDFPRGCSENTWAGGARRRREAARAVGTAQPCQVPELGTASNQRFSPRNRTR